MGAWEDLNDNMNQAEAPYTLLLPPWDAVRASDPPPLNPELIPGVLRRGYVGLIGGKKKVGKTLLSQQLEIRAVVGGKWCGLEIPGGMRCMHIDPEVHPAELNNRFAKICDLIGADKHLVDTHIVKWSLRGVLTSSGKPATISDVAQDVEARCKPGDFDLIVIDSASALLEGDENSSVELSRFFANIHRIAKATGATVIVVAHFGKAKDGDREAADRVRGSSVWGDRPDAVLTVTQVFPRDGDTSDYLDDGEIACLLESGGLRSFGFFEPVPLIFKYPCHRVDVDGITKGWRPRSSSDTSRRKGGMATGELTTAKKEAKNARIVAALLAHFYTEQVGADGLIMKEAAEIAGEDQRAVKDALGYDEVNAPEGTNEYLKVVKVSARKFFIRPRNPPRASPEELPVECD